MKSALKKLLTGLSLSHEYICLASELLQPLEVYMVSRSEDGFIKVSSSHVFIGYKPLIIAIVFESENYILNNEEACLSFSDKTFEANKLWKGFRIDTKSIANLLMIKKETRKVGDSIVAIYEGVYGHHHFIRSIYQLSNTVISKFKKKVIENIFLPGNLYDQVRIAYAIARKISLITVSENGQMNVFPTDLHGKIDNDFYIGSLRIGGEACRQVESIKKIVISDIDLSYFQSTYDLGKNHMRKLRSFTEFELSDEHSEFFKFPLPRGVGGYKELELKDAFDLGIHRIFIYRIMNEGNVRPISTLFHIHSYYAQWRINNKLSTEYLLRKSNS